MSVSLIRLAGLVCRTSYPSGVWAFESLHTHQFASVTGIGIPPVFKNQGLSVRFAPLAPSFRPVANWQSGWLKISVDLSSNLSGPTISSCGNPLSRSGHP